jgi:hypothetical protein
MDRRTVKSTTMGGGGDKLSTEKYITGTLYNPKLGVLIGACVKKALTNM